MSPETLHRKCRETRLTAPIVDRPVCRRFFFYRELQFRSYEGAIYMYRFHLNFMLILQNGDLRGTRNCWKGSSNIYFLKGVLSGYHAHKKNVNLITLLKMDPVFQYRSHECLQPSKWNHFMYRLKQKKNIFSLFSDCM
jgi:hypothetical protein